MSKRGNIHLRIEDASGCLDDADSLVVGRKGVESVLLVLDNSYELQTNILGVHLGGEAVGQGLLLAAGDLQAIARAGEVTEDLSLSARLLDERTTNNGDRDGLGLLVVNGKTGLGGVAVDQLDAKDLGLREAGGDSDLQVGRLGILDDFFDILDLEKQTVSGLSSCAANAELVCSPLALRLRRVRAARAAATGVSKQP